MMVMVMMVIAMVGMMMLVVMVLVMDAMDWVVVRLMAEVVLIEAAVTGWIDVWMVVSPV